MRQSDMPVQKHIKDLLVRSRNKTRDRKTSPRLERVAPEQPVSHVEIRWTKQQLESFGQLASGPSAPPTPALLDLMKRN